MMILLLAIFLLSAVCSNNYGMAEMRMLKEIRQLEFENNTERFAGAAIEDLRGIIGDVQKAKSLIPSENITNEYYSSIANRQFNIGLACLAQSVVEERSSEQEAMALQEKDGNIPFREELYYLSKDSLRYLKKDFQNYLMGFLITGAKKIGNKSPVTAAVLHHWSINSKEISDFSKFNLDKYAELVVASAMKKHYETKDNCGCTII